METVMLKNGAEEVKPLVAATMLSLQTLMKEKPIVLYELVMLCRDPNHKLFGISGEDLKQRSLIQSHTDGTVSVHDSIRNIVLSAVTGEELDMTLGSPINP